MEIWKHGVLFEFQFLDEYQLLISLAAAGTCLRKVLRYSTFSIKKLEVYTFITL